MLITVLKSKIHMGELTGAELDYEGSLGISTDLLAASGILPYEQVLIANAENRDRLVTYAIPLESKGELVLNGPAARFGKKGDRVVIMTFAQVPEEDAGKVKPRVLRPGPGNSIPRDG